MGTKTAREYWQERFGEYPQNDTEKLACAMMQEYFTEHSTSQKETIERLREELSNVNKSIDNLLKDNRVLKSSLMEIREQSVAALEVIALKNKGKSEQLLNTTHSTKIENHADNNSPAYIGRTGPRI